MSVIIRPSMPIEDLEHIILNVSSISEEIRNALACDTFPVDDHNVLDEESGDDLFGRTVDHETGLVNPNRYDMDKQHVYGSLNNDIGDGIFVQVLNGVDKGDVVGVMCGHLGVKDPHSTSEYTCSIPGLKTTGGHEIILECESRKGKKGTHIINSSSSPNCVMFVTYIKCEVDDGADFFVPLVVVQTKEIVDDGEYLALDYGDNFVIENMMVPGSRSLQYKLAGDRMDTFLKAKASNPRKELQKKATAKAKAQNRGKARGRPARHIKR